MRENKDCVIEDSAFWIIDKEYGPLFNEEGSMGEGH